ncbi:MULTISPECIES: alpha/beta hydrolase family protein [Paenibacillus]|uniref:Alpha/beta hydrolase family protein n=1 Tax=Paenibacillus violae TaxID=3077234 RepID=A0ABU3RDC0_9BACL|nr:MULTISPECIES: alpha/beta hydrolase family protein [Paenibacillus]MDU0202252.1 alpha/beta hydrolase family protein [Paenibacillus sp. PFR10]MEC0266003.1 alpha/beta hydrolase family protein [Paenibacillus anseongense]
MAFIDCHFYSDSLGVSASMYVILPQHAQNQIGIASASYGTSKHPTLYLLHGLSDDHTIWMRRTSIERYAAKLGIAVVMPAVNRSFYTDMAAGPKYWTFISEELPAIARSFFPLAEERELNYAAGLSMGGYGAMKLALTHPDRFAAAASLSGAVDISHRALNFPDEFKLIYGDVTSIKGSKNDLFYLAEQVKASKGPKPDLYQCCGTEDFLYEDNIRFRNYCRELGLDLTYEEGPGEHEWGYWDRQIQNVLNWLPLPARG